MAGVVLTTFADVIDHLIDYLGADTSKEGKRYARRAVQNAYREMANGHRWVIYYNRGRLNTNPQQTTGTVAYDHTGGTYERMLTLTGATWPSYAPLSTIRIGTVSYEVDQLKSATVLTLTNASNPGADLAAGTTYTLFQDTYALPSDFIATDEIILVGFARLLAYERPGEWLDRQRLTSGPATPAIYTITGDPNYFGSLALRFWPPPDQQYQVDFLYQRRPRPLLLDSYSTGTVSVTNGSAVATGSGTSWTTSMIGSTIMIGADGLTVPTGAEGPSPFAIQRTVIDVPSGTSLTMDAVVGQTLTGVKYQISDPVDLEPGAMTTYFLRECEKQARLIRRMKHTVEELKELAEAMERAFEADARSFAPRSASTRGLFRQRLANMPRGPDIS